MPSSTRSLMTHPIFSTSGGRPGGTDLDVGLAAVVAVGHLEVAHAPAGHREVGQDPAGAVHRQPVQPDAEAVPPLVELLTEGIHQPLLLAVRQVQVDAPPAL